MNLNFLKISDSFLGRNGYLLLASAWLFTLSFIIDNYWSGSSTTRTVQSSVQRNIWRNESKSNEFTSDTAFINKIIKGAYTEKQLEDVVGKRLLLFYL